MNIGSRHRSLREQVCDELRERITRCELLPGTRLVEEALAAELGVSRNPLREALQTLAAEGFVRTEPRRGAVVAQIAPHEFENLFDVRESLEVLASRLAARRTTPAGAERLREVLTRAATAEGSGDLDAAGAACGELHLAVVDGSGNDVLRALYLTVHQRLRWVSHLHPDVRPAHPSAQHARIVEAIVAGDEEAAAAAAAEHVATARTAHAAAFSG